MYQKLKPSPYKTIIIIPYLWRICLLSVLTELYALLLTDILVLLERHEERDKFYLRCYTVEGLGGVKEELSPVIRLKDCLLRSAAADKGRNP